MCCLRCLPKIHFSTQRFKFSQTVQTRKQKGVYDIPVKPPRCVSVNKPYTSQQFHLFCKTCKTPLHPNNNAIIFVPKRTCLFLGGNGRGSKQTRVGEEGDKGVLRTHTRGTRLYITSVYAIRRTDIYSDRLRKISQ